jgi:uncharacterized protein YbaP (TraB family)
MPGRYRTSGPRRAIDVLLFACVIGCLLLLTVPAYARPPLWIAHGRHATLYLFGSIHLLPRGYDWAPEALVAALPKASEIWFELPIDGATNAAAGKLTSAYGYLPAGDRLANHLTADEDDRMKRVAGQLGVGYEALESMRPWLAEVTLSLTVDEQQGATAAWGVEQQLQGLTPPSALRRALETPAEQFGFLAGATLPDQIASLDATLQEITDDPGSFTRMLKGWMTGDLRELDADALAPLWRASPALYRRLLTDRNARWANQLRARLKAGRGAVIIVVGIGHLIGPEGVPARLRAMGFRVDGP